MKNGLAHPVETLDVQKIVSSTLKILYFAFMNDALANRFNNFVLIFQDVENLLTIMEQQNKDFEHALEDDKNQIAAVKEEKCKLEKVGCIVNKADFKEPCSSLIYPSQLFINGENNLPLYILTFLTAYFNNFIMKQFLNNLKQIGENIICLTFHVEIIPIMFQEKDKLNQEHLQLQKQHSILQKRMKEMGDVSN